MTGLIPIAFTTPVSGVQYIGILIPMDGRRVIVRKTATDAQTLFQYSATYAAEADFLTAWGNIAAVAFNSGVNVEANLAPLFAAFGTPTVVQAAAVSTTTPQHVILDSAAGGAVATADNQAQELVQLKAVNTTLGQPLPLPTGAATESTLQKLMPAAAPALTRTAYFSVSASQGLVNLKAGATSLYKIHMSNAASATRVLAFYNKATAPVAGDVPALSFVLPAGASLRYSLDGLADSFPLGLSFSISTTQGPLGLLAATALAALGANEVFFVAHYV